MFEEHTRHRFFARYRSCLIFRWLVSECRVSLATHKHTSHRDEKKLRVVSHSNRIRIDMALVPFSFALFLLWLIVGFMSNGRDQFDLAGYFSGRMIANINVEEAQVFVRAEQLVVGGLVSAQKFADRDGSEACIVPLFRCTNRSGRLFDTFLEKGCHVRSLVVRA